MTKLKKFAQTKLAFAIAFGTLFGLTLAPATTFAKTVGETCTSFTDCDSGLSCDKATSKCIKDTFGVSPIDSEVSGSLGNKDLRTTVASLINVALSLLGVIAVVIILAGGFKWMTAGGAEDKVGEARKMIFSGIIGLAIILSAWAIALFVLNQLAKATGVGANVPTINETP